MLPGDREWRKVKTRHGIVDVFKTYDAAKSIAARILIRELHGDCCGINEARYGKA